MCADFVIPDPPWLVCKGGESRIFELCDSGEAGVEMQVLDGNQVVLARRRFDTRRSAIEWGFEERRLLQFDGWKHPYDAEVDETFEDGVRNFNFLTLSSRGRQSPLWQAMIQIPAGRRAAETYAGAPYLGLLTTDELFARFRLLTISLMDVNTDGLLQPAPSPEWRDKWIHAMTEILLRDLSLDDERSRADWSFLQTPSFRRAVSAYSRRTLNWSDQVLVKYGSARYLRPALERGTIRVSPASSYDDPSLNAARRDAELERVLVDAATDLTSTLGRQSDTMAPEERALYERAVQSVTDYYIFCLAGSWELRLFDDFNADACLVITDPARFASALRDAAHTQLPGWHFTCAPVRYIDPVQDLRFADTRTDVRFAPFDCKDFRYSYQKEVRAAWLPPSSDAPRTGLDHFFVTLGGLEEYCELIVI